MSKYVHVFTDQLDEQENNVIDMPCGPWILTHSETGPVGDIMISNKS